MVSQNEENSTNKDAFAVDPRSGLSFIEQLQISSNRPCTKLNTPYLIGVNEDAKIAILTKTRCKQWNCETCAARNAKTWIAKIINGINKLGGSWYFLTLTSHRKWRKASSVKCIRMGWKKFYNRILAKFEKSAQNIYYAKVWEQHETGAFHLHILINVCLGTRWAKNNARRTGMGHQADWHEVSNAGKVAGYISKYTLKNATHARGGIAWPKGLRRIETSHKWPVLPQIEGSDLVEWIVKMNRDGQLITANAYHLRGYELLDTVKE